MAAGNSSPRVLFSTPRLGQIALSFHQGSVVTLKQLDDAVHELQLYALNRGMIPIAGIISRPLDNDRHEILGFGHNELADGVPGVHGETGAVKGMGRVAGGYQDLVATSSLSPCPFCQCTLARQLGIKTIRILDDRNYRPDKGDYEKVGVTPLIAPHSGIESTFGGWVNDPVNRTLWDRDIGIPVGARGIPRRFTPEETQALVRRVVRVALEGAQHGEIPIGAAIVDDLGQVVGSSHAKIVTDNDPSKTAAMAAWRASGSRNDWGKYTLVLSAGPDPIALSMFKIFGFGQLIIASSDVYRGHTSEVQAINKPVVIAGGGEESDQALSSWLAGKPVSLAREYLGIGWASED